MQASTQTNRQCVCVCVCVRYKLERKRRELPRDNMRLRREDSESRELVTRSDLMISELLNEFSTSYHSSDLSFPQNVSIIGYT